MAGKPKWGNFKNNIHCQFVIPLNRLYFRLIISQNKSSLTPVVDFTFQKYAFKLVVFSTFIWNSWFLQHPGDTSRSLMDSFNGLQRQFKWTKILLAFVFIVLIAIIIVAFSIQPSCPEPGSMTSDGKYESERKGKFHKINSKIYSIKFREFKSFIAKLNKKLFSRNIFKWEKTPRYSTMSCFTIMRPLCKILWIFRNNFEIESKFLVLSDWTTHHDNFTTYVLYQV